MYEDLVAVMSVLAASASRKIGIAVRLSPAGYLGALTAWTGFTLPFAIPLVPFGLAARI
jgi:chromate transporter